MKKILLTIFTFLLFGTSGFTQEKDVLFLVSNADAISSSDSIARIMMVNTGYNVTTMTGSSSVVGDTAGMEVVVISSSLASGTVNKFAWIDLPVLVWENGNYDDFGLTINQGTTDLDPAEITLLLDTHPLTTGLTVGTISLGDKGKFTRGNPYIATSNSAVLLATLKHNAEDVGAWFVFEVGDSLAPSRSTKPGFPVGGLAVGMRIGLPFEDKTFESASPEAATILLNSIDYALDGAMETTFPVAHVNIVDDTVNIPAGKRLEIKTFVFPSNATNNSITFTSMDESVASVNTTTGMMTALGAGTTKVAVETADGAYSDTLVVNVSDDGVPAILFLVSNAANLNASDTKIVELMENTGYTVNVVTGGDSDVGDTLAQDVVVISSTLTSGTVNKFAWIDLPVLVWENGNYDDFGLTINQGTTDLDPAEITLLLDTHPLTTGLTAGTITLGDKGKFTRGNPYIAESNSAVILATLKNNGVDVGTWFVFEVGDSLAPSRSGKPGFPLDGLAVGMRIGLPFEDNTFGSASPEATTILLNSIDYALDGAIETTIPTADLIINGPSNDTLRLAPGQDSLIAAAVFPSNATDKTITYLSRDESIATYVDGTATSVTVGGTYLVAEAAGLTDSVYVLVETISVTGVSLDQSTASIGVGETVQLRATVAPADATTNTVTWSSGDPTIATVNATGLVTGVAAGITTITVTTVDGSFTALADITVNAATIAVTGVTLDQSAASVEVGQTVLLTATVAPANATTSTVTWASDDQAIATVDATGLVTGVAAGTATITVTTDDGSFTAPAVITVTSGVSVEGISADHFNIYPNPVQNKLMIEGKNITSIDVYNVIGNKVMHINENVTGINVSSLLNGIYLMKITTSEGVAVASFVKN